MIRSWENCVAGGTRPQRRVPAALRLSGMHRPYYCNIPRPAHPMTSSGTGALFTDSLQIAGLLTDMVRELRTPKAHGVRHGTATGGWNLTSWDCGNLARMLQREGFLLKATYCGDGSWAVLAERSVRDRFVVAAGLPTSRDAEEWISRECVVDRATFQCVARSVRPAFESIC